MAGECVNLLFRSLVGSRVGLWATGVSAFELKYTPQFCGLSSLTSEANRNLQQTSRCFEYCTFSLFDIPGERRHRVSGACRVDEIKESLRLRSKDPNCERMQVEC